MADKKKKPQGVVPKEAISFFASKKLKPSFDYRDVWREEHAIAFTVAKAVKLDILQDIQSELQKSLSSGETFAQFKKNLTPILQKKGWWGKREMIDPETGEQKLVQLGSPRRLKVIYDNNMRTARAAGQWERIQRTKKALPYLIYELGPSREHRPEHVRWSGTILPVDHPFWKTHFTPNGYGCKCRIRQITQREYDRLVKTGNYKTEAPEIKYIPWENKRTGLIEDVPEGIDPSWDTNAGYLRQIGIDRSFVSKAQALDNIEDPASLFVSPVKLAEYSAWSAKMQATKRAGGELRTVGVLGSSEIDFFAKQGKSPEEIITVVEGRLMSKSGKAERHRRKGDALSPQQWEDLPKLLPQAEHIFWYGKGKELIYFIPTDKADYYIKVVISSGYQSKRTRKAGWQEKLNMVRTALIAKKVDMESLAKRKEYERVK